MSPSVALLPPHRWNIMIRGYGPSGPLAGAGGTATRTSIGTSSKDGTVLRGRAGTEAASSHSRTPFDCTAQATGVPDAVNTPGIAACAAGVAIVAIAQRHATAIAAHTAAVWARRMPRL